MAEKVEKFKLSQEAIDWGKKYGQFQKMQRALGIRLKLQLNEAEKTKQLLEQAEGQISKLINVAPREPVNEIEGQKGNADGDTRGFIGELR